MHWKPSPWIAALLGFFLQPFGMLYVVRPKLALVYLLLGVLPLFFDKYFVPAGWEGFFTFGYVVAIICSIHTYRIAKNYIETSERPWYSKWYGLVSIPLALFLSVFVIIAFLFEPFRFPSTSMSPNIGHGDHIVVSKIGFNNISSFGIELFKGRPSRVIERGEIIAFEYPQDPEIYYVKRIVGLPGDRIEYRDKFLYVNGHKVLKELLHESEGKVTYAETIDGVSYNIINDKERRSRDHEFSVSQGAYFVMGDNRDHSNDSRYWGEVPDDAIIGRVIHVFH